jgi:hypothetical protein
VGLCDRDTGEKRSSAPSIAAFSVNTRPASPVRVKRDETFQSGAGRSVFNVAANEPIDAKEWNFTLEDERPKHGIRT